MEICIRGELKVELGVCRPMRNSKWRRYIVIVIRSCILNDWDGVKNGGMCWVLDLNVGRGGERRRGGGGGDGGNGGHFESTR